MPVYDIDLDNFIYNYFSRIPKADLRSLEYGASLDLYRNYRDLAVRVAQVKYLGIDTDNIMHFRLMGDKNRDSFWDENYKDYGTYWYLKYRI